MRELLLLLCRFAFVDFDSVELAAAAIEEHNGREVDGRRLHLSSPVRRKSRPRMSLHLYYTKSVIHVLYLCQCVYIG